MNDDLYTPWADLSTRKVAFPETSASLVSGEPWRREEWMKFFERYRRPLHDYARRNFRFNAQEAEEAFSEMVCTFVEHPQVVPPGPGVTFRSMICQIYRNKVLQVMRRSKRWYNRLQKGGAFMQPAASRDSSGERRRQRCLLAVKEAFRRDADRDVADRFGITERDRIIWKAAKVEKVPQVVIAERLGLSTSTVSAAVRKVQGYHLSLAQQLLDP